jgi:hypothetical protein
MAIREVRMRDPLENLTMAIGLLQSHILASDSTYDAAKMFDHQAMPVLPVEMALNLLMPLLSETGEEWSWTGGEGKP